MAVLGKNIRSQLQNQLNENPNKNQNSKLSYMYTEKMSSSDDSEDCLDPLNEELRNIQSVIFITRENIDALNAKFADFPDPPSMYIAEYQDLTSRLHELELKERELVERLQQNEENDEQTTATTTEDVAEASQYSIYIFPVLFIFYFIFPSMYHCVCVCDVC